MQSISIIIISIYDYGIEIQIKTLSTQGKLENETKLGH